METSQPQRKSPKHIILEYAKSIAIALLLALFIRTFVVQAFKIPSGSMIPTLLIGDHILVTKFAYGVKIPFSHHSLWDRATPARGDIVVFRYPLDPEKDFIKRVIGLPGETVAVKNKMVYINNALMEEGYVQHTDPKVLPAEISPRDNMAPLTVPPHSLFVMGDNRDESYDSRFWKFVDIAAVKGKALVVYWSWNAHGQLSLDPHSFFLRWNRIGRLIE